MGGNRGLYTPVLFVYMESATRVMAANQGVYNAFLAAGIVFALITDQADVATFFAACVAIAGVVGGLTSSPKIIVIQGVPAILALALLIV